MPTSWLQNTFHCNDVYESNLLDDVLGAGGFGAFIVRPQL